MRWRTTVWASGFVALASCAADTVEPQVTPDDVALVDAAPDVAPPDVVASDALPADAALDAPVDATVRDASAIDAARDAAAAEDDAEVVSVTFPERLACGRAATATVVVRNTGSATWTRAGGYKLGAVGDHDPLHPGDARVWLDEGVSVAPGATHAFEIGLAAPTAPASFTLRWQMVHELVRWFGPITARDVMVACDAPPDAGPPDVPTDFDLASATVLNSPSDVATWAETARITALDLGADGVYIDFTRRDGPGSWPDVPFITPGEDLQYTLWIVLYVDGRWYTSGCIQYWRGLDRNGGPPSGYAMNWYYDPGRWRPMTGHQPAVGERVGFFVTAGNARNVTDHSGSRVFERSNVVFVPFPSDMGAVFRY